MEFLGFDADDGRLIDRFDSQGARSEDGTRAPIRVDQTGFWISGEEHESGSQSGMTALVMEATRCVLR